MKKKGFTLIELLAVIVILAIIALIATPMVLDTIDNAKKGSFEQTLKNIVKAAELYQAREELDNPITDCRYFSFANDVNEVTVRDQKSYYPLKELELKGSLPKEGELEICSVSIKMNASDGKYSGSYEDGKINVSEGDLGDSDLTSGELTINVEKQSKWTSSKEVTITGTTEDYTIEYRIIKYNEETGVEEDTGYQEYTAAFTLDTVATEEHPTTVIARYKNGETYSDDKSIVITKIDPTPPTNTAPTLVASTTKPTSEATIIMRQADDESGLDLDSVMYAIHVYDENNNYLDGWHQDNSLLTGLVAGYEYEIYTMVDNGAGSSMDSSAYYYTHTVESGSCYINLSSNSTSDWSTSKNYYITGTTIEGEAFAGSYEDGMELQYQIGGTDADKWATADDIFTVTENTTIYCRVWDGTNVLGSGSTAVNKIDTTEPELAINSVSSSYGGVDKSSITLEFTASDAESDISKTVCYYGISQSYLGNTGQHYSKGAVTANGNTCTISNLLNNQTYYYRVVTTNGAGLTTEETASIKTANLEAGYCAASFVQEAGSYTVGDRYYCNPGSGGAKEFYVIDSTSTDVTLWYPYEAAYSAACNNYQWILSGTAYYYDCEDDPSALDAALSSLNWNSVTVSVPTYDQIYALGNSTTLPATFPEVAEAWLAEAAYILNNTLYEADYDDSGTIPSDRYSILPSITVSKDKLSS